MTTRATLTSVTNTRTERISGGRLIGSRWFPFFMLLPSFVLIIFVTGFPLLYSLYVSFTPYDLLRPQSLAFDISKAFNNYGQLLNDPVFWRALGNTIVFLTVTVNLELVLAIGLSQILARVNWGQSVLRVLLMVPMMFAPVLVGFQFRWFFNDTVGLVNNVLLLLGVQNPPVWLVDEPLGMIAIMIAVIWMNVPVTTIILLAGTLALPPELFEAAEVDGASAWQKFRKITLPLLAPFTYIALTLRSLDVARAYDIVRIMTGGGPGNRTELIWTYVGRLAIDSNKFGLGAAMSFITVIISLAFTVYLFRQLVKVRIVQ
ncbi:MAG: sugar ABC transporter permease [Anaerolineae bacterium]